MDNWFRNVPCSGSWVEMKSPQELFAQEPHRVVACGHWLHIDVRGTLLPVAYTDVKIVPPPT